MGMSSEICKDCPLFREGGCEGQEPTPDPCPTLEKYEEHYGISPKADTSADQRPNAPKRPTVTRFVFDPNRSTEVHPRYKEVQVPAKVRTLPQHNPPTKNEPSTHASRTSEKY